MNDFEDEIDTLIINGVAFVKRWLHLEIME